VSNNKNVDDRAMMLVTLSWSIVIFWLRSKIVTTQIISMWYHKFWYYRGLYDVDIVGHEFEIYYRGLYDVDIVGHEFEIMMRSKVI